MKRMMAAAAGLVLPTLFGVVTATPALADCPADAFCLYESSGYRDGELRLRVGTNCYQLPSSMDNDANAMRNYRNHAVKMWDFPGCAGSLTYTAKALSYDSNFSNNGFTNKASSLKRI